MLFVIIMLNCLVYILIILCAIMNMLNTLQETAISDFYRAAWNADAV